VPLYYITTYSTSVLSWSSSTGSLMLAINNAVNAISRILMGLLADRVGRQNTMVSSVRATPSCPARSNLHPN
jgi:MFS family permease